MRWSSPSPGRAWRSTGRPDRCASPWRRWPRRSCGPRRRRRTLARRSTGRKGTIAADAVAEFGRLAATASAPIDHRSTADYRRHSIDVLARRLLRRAFTVTGAGKRAICERQRAAPTRCTSTGSIVRSPESGSGRACCTCSVSGSGCTAPKEPASKVSAARAPCWSMALVCSCLVLAASAIGLPIVTIEGIAGAGEQPTDVQRAFVDAGAVQCGFCTPGLVMAVHDLLDRNVAPTWRRSPRSCPATSAGAPVMGGSSPQCSKSG